MGRHSIKVKITLLLTVIITSLVVLLLILNSTLSEKFYFSDKQECMLNTYSKIDQIMSDYDAGTVSESQMSDSIEQLTGSAAMSVIVVNSDWTTVYSNINGEQDMINRLLRSIFNKDVFGTSDSAPQQNSNNENVPGDMQDMSNPDNNNPDKGNLDNGSPDKNNPKNKDDVSINMSDSGIEESRDIMTQTDLYTLQKVYDNRLGDDYYELFGTLSNGDSIMLRMALQGIKDNVSISNTFITYVGIGILIIGVIAAYIFSSYITKPIQQLSDIAERMSNLDFDVKYHGKDKSEIGVLGNSMNNMSKKLEENISQLKSANKELQRDIDRKVKMEEVRTEFLSNVSHELKTPIALIQGYAEGLKEGISDDPESMDFYCDVIIDEAGKMNNMVKKLLTLNQIEFGNEELVMERFDIIELITSIVNANELRASQKGIQIEFNQRDEHIDVWSDEYKIEEVVTNYITNAINHCDFENRIEVSVERIGDDVRVHVFNTGKNIPEEDIPNIWQKFYKVDKARTREYGGNGIGLSIVKDIVDRMNGTIKLESKENVGTTFTVTIPLEIDHNAEKEQQKKVEKPDLSGKSVLLVEDNELNLEIAKMLLEDEKMVVTTAENGKEAVDIVSQSVPGRFDFIFMDIMMPVMDGLEAARQIRTLNRKDTKEIPIIAMTANAFQDDIRDCIDAGMNAHIAKPIDSKKIEDTLQLVLKQKMQ